MRYFSAVIDKVHFGYAIMKVDELVFNRDTGNTIKKPVSNNVLKHIAENALASTNRTLERYQVEFEELYPTKVAKRVNGEFVESREYRQELINLLKLELF